MNKNRYSYFGLISGLIFTFLIFVSSSTDVKPDAQNINDNEAIAFELPQIVKPPKLDKDFYFADEKIPFNQDTRERLDREMMVNSYYHSSTLMVLKYSTRYFPTMERILAEEGVPDDFKYLAVAESGLNNAKSPAGAKGVWQFMRAASSDFNLEINKEVDERFHLEKATYAACKYLKQLKRMFGTWHNAAAAYNVGPGNLKKLMRSQGEDSYVDLNVNSETSRYLFRLVALKEIMSSPSSFGFQLDEDDYYPVLEDTYNIEVKKTIPSLSDFAHENGTTYRMLKYYNAWLLTDKLTVAKNTYYIKIPKA